MFYTWFSIQAEHVFFITWDQNTESMWRQERRQIKNLKEWQLGRVVLCNTNCFFKFASYLWKVNFFRRESTHTQTGKTNDRFTQKLVPDINICICKYINLYSFDCFITTIACFYFFDKFSLFSDSFLVWGVDENLFQGTSPDNDIVSSSLVFCKKKISQSWLF